MSDLTLSEMTGLLKWTGIGLAFLSVLLILVRIALWELRRIARLQVARTDLDLIGVQAKVTQTIKPHKPGKIRYQTAEGSQVGEAVSDQTIRSGKTVLITAIHRGLFQVLPDMDIGGPGHSHHPADAAAGDSAVSGAQSGRSGG